MSAGLRLCDVTFSSGDVVLAGSLAVPDQDRASASVVMVGGDGPSDRDNGNFFPPIREHLAAAGIAVLSYDKRGVGSSSGDWRDATMDDLAADAAAALGFLRGQAGTRAEAAGLFGHSEGGWVVLRAAASRDDVPWVITNGCPGMTPAAQNRHALATALRQAGAPDASSTLALYDRLTEAGRRNSTFAEAMRLIESVRPSPVFFSNYWYDVDERVWGFLSRKQDHDPIPDALRLRCPHLAIFGSADERVPVPDSIHRFGATACHPDRHHRARLTIEVFPGASHQLRADAGTRLAPGLLDTLTGWIKARTGSNPDS